MTIAQACIPSGRRVNGNDGPAFDAAGYEPEPGIAILGSSNETAMGTPTTAVDHGHSGGQNGAQVRRQMLTDTAPSGAP
jgi:hypothetical protein